MELKLQKSKVRLDIYGELFEIDKPTYGFAKEWQSKIKGMTEQEVTEYTIQTLVDFGIPLNVIESLEVDHLAQVVEAIFGAKKK